MNIALDEYGRPFVLLRDDDDRRRRVKGVDAYRSNIIAAKSVCELLKTSLGPKGMDKIIVSPDGDVTVTNDGATILNRMEIENQCAKLLVELSQSQDAEIGDGTTGVVILAGCLLNNALALINKGVHPLRIADGFERASQLAIQKLQEIAMKVNILENKKKILVDTAVTALGSKVVSNRKKELAEIAVEAVLSVADLERGDVNLDLIKVDGKAGGLLEESRLIKGIVLHKEFSHSQMNKRITDAKIAILTCPFEPPKPKTKYKIDISNVADYQKLQKFEQNYFIDMIKKVKSVGANLVICQWGFDDEANHLLLKENIPAIRWVGGVELEMIALACKGRIVPRVEELTEEKLGRAESVTEMSSGTMGDKYIMIERCLNSKSVTVVLHGGNRMLVDEAERSLHDSICVVRNLIRDNRIICGGGAAEIALARHLEINADKVEGIEQFAIQGFSNALLGVVEALASNCGLNAIETLQHVKALQEETDNPHVGVDCMQMGTNDMREQEVYETFASKEQQIMLATQVVKMILKIDDVIAPNDI